MEMELGTKAVLEEQRCAIVDQAFFELNMREAKAKNTPTKSNTATPSTNCGAFQQKQYLLITELRNRERAHRETLVHMIKEAKELRKVCCSDAELREEAYQDAVSQDGGKTLETELRESQSTVNLLTQHMKQLQGVINSLSESH